MSGAALTASQEWKRGWGLVLAAFIGLSLTSVVAGSLSMFIQPIGDEFGWDRATVSFGFTIGNVFTAILSPFFGLAIDRFGSRKIALPGIILTTMAIAAFSQADGSVAQWIGLWVIYAIVSISVKTTVWTAAVAGMFNAGRGMALGVILCGMAAAGVILPPLAEWLITSFGWRLAYIYLACGWGGVTLLFCLVFFFDAHDLKRRASAALQDAKASLAPTFSGLTISEAWRSPALWKIAISALIIMVVSVGLAIHQIAILGEAGVTRGEAAWLASMAGAMGILGKLVSGWLLDRFHARWVGGITLMASAAAFALLIDGVTSTTLIVIAMLVNGYTQGCKLQITGYLTARYAGMSKYGTIYGFMNGIVAAGSGFGPFIAGLMYDSSGNYTMFLIMGAIVSLISGALIVSLPAYPRWEDESVVEGGRA